MTTKFTQSTATTGQRTAQKTASLGGTDEEPTLILGFDGKVHIGASDEGRTGSLTKNSQGQKTCKLEEIE